MIIQDADYSIKSGSMDTPIIIGDRSTLRLFNHDVTSTYCPYEDPKQKQFLLDESAKMGFTVEQFLENMTKPVMVAFIMSMNFYHCKNVGLGIGKDNSGKNFNKKKNRGKARVDKSYVLMITKGYKAKDGVIGGSRLGDTAHHFCAGHTRTYTKERPLFGKIVGTVWIPAHARGVKTAGEIDKTYKQTVPDPVPS